MPRRARPTHLMFVLAFAALFPTIAPAQECGDLLGSLQPVGAYDRVDAFDDLVLVRDIEFRRVATVDVSDPMAPVEVGNYDPSDVLDNDGLVDDVAVYADVGFLVEGTRLLVLDLSDPAAPTLVSNFEVLGALTHVDAWGDLAVAYDLELQRLQIFDVTNPMLPGLVANYDVGGTIEDLTVYETTVLLSRGSSVDVIDVSDPGAPALLETLINVPTIATGRVGAAPDQVMMVSREFLGLDDNIDILDGSDPADDGLPRLDQITFDEPDDVSVSACRGFVVGEGLQIFDLEDCGACRIRCAPDQVTMCLGENDRFRVTVDWETADDTGEARRVDVGRRDSGAFWFFGPDNLELLIKVLDACELPGFENFWVLFSASTNQGYTVRVEDLFAGVQRTYENPLDTLARARIDTAAFDTCDVPSE